MRRVHMKRARTCAACTPQLPRTWNARAHAARRPARPRTASPHSALICAGQRKRYHAPSGSCRRRLEKKINARLHVLSCDVPGGADLVSQLLHSRFVGAVEVFSVGRKIRPESRSRAAAASLRPRWDCLLRSICVHARTAFRMPAKAPTMTSTDCKPAHKHASGSSGGSAACCPRQ